MSALHLKLETKKHTGYARGVFVALFLSLLVAPRAFAGVTYVAAPQGRTADGVLKFQFPNIASTVGSLYYFADLEIEPDARTPVDLSKIAIGFSGIATDNPALLGQLTYRVGNTLRIGVGAVGWRDMAFASLFRNVQRDGKRLSLTVTGIDGAVTEARLVFRLLKLTDFVPPFVNLKIEAPVRDGFTIRGERVKARLSAWPGAVSYRCRLDNAPWTRCEDGWDPGALAKGWHRVDARAWNSVGFAGFPTAQWFYILPPAEPPAPLVIVDVVEPSEAVHNAAQVRVTFHRQNLTPTNEGFCQFDSGPIAPCVSPVMFTDFAEGRHQVSIRGAVAGQASTVQWTTDRTAPKIAFVTVPAVLSASTEATFAFQSDEASVFRCALDNDTLSECSSPVTFSNLSDGAHELHVTGTDAVGNVSAELLYHWTVDTTPPDVPSLVAAPSDSEVSTTTMTLTFAGSEPNLRFECQLDSGDWTECTSPWAFNVLEGPHVASVHAIDPLGFVGQAADHAWTVVLTPPALNLVRTRPQEPLGRDTGAEFHIDTGGAPATLECNLDGAVAPSCGPVVTFTVAEGTHRFEARSVGPTGAASAWVSSEWTVDLTPPTLAVDYGTVGNLTTQSSLTVQFVAEGAVSATCEIDGAAVPCTSPYAVNGIADGPHTFVLRAVDAAGNEASTSKKWVVDSIAPIVTLTNVTPGWTPTQSRTLTMEFTVNDPKAVAECQFDNGAWSVCTSPWTLNGVVDGDHSASVHARDLAGNISAPVTHAWTVAAPFPITDVTVVPLTQTSVRISWRTPIGSTTQVAYGLGSLAGGYTLSTTTTELLTQVTTHTVVLTGLTADTAYVAQPRSKSGTALSVGDPIGFRTPRP